MPKNSFFPLFINIIILGVFSINTAQVIDGHVNLSTQAEVNSFVGTSINGDLVISGSDITDLTPLLMLVSVNGHLSIDYNDALMNLDGLSSIASVGGRIWIAHNNVLTNIDGLSKIPSVVGGGLSIFSNDALTNIDGLSNITSVRYVEISYNSALTNVNGLKGITSAVDLRVSYNDAITNLDGLSKIISISRNLYIHNNSALTNIDSLKNIISVGGNLAISDNNTLSNIDGLSNVSSVDGKLQINSNDALTNLDGLNSIVSVGDELRISLNLILTNLDGLNNITFVGANLKVLANYSLSSFCGLYLLLSSEGLQGEYDINYNLINPTQREIINAGPCTTSIEVVKNDLAPKKYELQQNYPNPFNPSTTISYSLPHSGLVQLKVYDLLGREVADLVNEEQAMGNYKVEFNASNLTSGVYLYRLQSSGFTETKKLVLLR